MHLIHPTLKIAHLGPKNVKNDPKINSISKVRIEGTIENKSCSTTWVDPKVVFEPNYDPKNSPLSKNDPKTKSNQKSELKKTYKIKVLQLHEYTLKQFLNPTPPPKKAS